MLNADSSTLKSESELQNRKIAPTIPSVAAFRWIARTTPTMSSIDCDGNSACSSVTR